MQIFVGNLEGTAAAAFSIRKQVWVARACPFRQSPGSVETPLCGNWCPLFEVDLEDLELKMHCGQGRRVTVTAEEGQ